MVERFHPSWPALFVAMLLLTDVPISRLGVEAADGDFFAEPSWQRLTEGMVYGQLDAYLRGSAVAADRQQLARLAWWDATAADSSAEDLLDRLVQCLALTDDRVGELTLLCSSTGAVGARPDFAWLADSQTDEFVRYNLRLYYGRWLVQNAYHDEALAWTDGLSPADVVAPEVLLFYRAVAEHSLVHADRSDALVAELLQRQGELPIRYQKLAALMQQDLVGLEDESLDHIARRMSDVQRRLALGHTGKAVQEVEQGVIDSLDKLIKRLEDMAQQQQAQSGAGGAPSGSPMQDSQLAELKGPGRVQPRDIGRGADWGNLPDKDRQQALQEIGRDFPSHYREVIEEYFRQLAAEPTDDLP